VRRIDVKPLFVIYDFSGYTAPPNNSMDVRAKQRLCYRVVFLPFTCVVAVSPHVNSAVEWRYTSDANPR